MPNPWEHHALASTNPGLPAWERPGARRANQTHSTTSGAGATKDGKQPSRCSTPGTQSQQAPPPANSSSANVQHQRCSQTPNQQQGTRTATQTYPPVQDRAGKNEKENWAKRFLHSVKRHLPRHPSRNARTGTGTMQNDRQSSGHQHAGSLARQQGHTTRNHREDVLYQRAQEVERSRLLQGWNVGIPSQSSSRR
ncbi:hypothetical protein P389DRAFT_195576 [Cystobasidium minutum MCA 4210]|uniref:uncharacterized protein n=1 Tax=Cystobasidium minutum MCA 4210 TaxID=1397322 RepID=UPI0034CDBDE9|eukprot:jgi/Rhomi1/195576/gm1.3790_g